MLVSNAFVLVQVVAETELAVTCIVVGAAVIEQRHCNRGASRRHLLRAARWLRLELYAVTTMAAPARGDRAEKRAELRPDPIG
jgi:hypothetical protein